MIENKNDFIEQEPYVPGEITNTILDEIFRGFDNMTKGEKKDD